jgi:DNA polymerase III gamma/tau subunit
VSLPEPRANPELFGHEAAAAALVEAALSGRLHHAYIFHGPKGVGKFTTAREFAKALLCKEPMRDLAGRVAACGGCESCTFTVSSAFSVAFTSRQEPDIMYGDLSFK